MAECEFEASDNTESDLVDSDLLGIIKFPSGHLIHVPFPENLLDFVVENLIDHLFPIFILTVFYAEGFCWLDDHIELVRGGVKNELALDVEGNS